MLFNSFGGDSLLLPAIAMAAVGIGLVLLVIGRSRLMSGEREFVTSVIATMKELERREKQLACALDTIPDPIVQRDREGRILLANRSFHRLVAESGASAGSPFAEPVVVGTLPPTLAPDGSRRQDEAICTPDGVRWFSWSETEIQDSDGTVSLIRSGREITDRIAGERALEGAKASAEAASEAKSRFLATVSHEFRTPLNGILGMADLLLGTPLQPDQTAYVQALRGSAESFLSLIEEILDFSRIEAGRIDLAEEAFELEPLVQGVVELLAPRAQDKGIEIACYVASDVPATVRSDRDRLRQVLFNLAGNAVKFTQSGGVSVEVSRGSGAEIVFAVEDTGPGIPESRLGAIFEEFEQGGRQPARGAGTGLGLAITRRIVERMGGSVEVASVPAQGSTFSVRLPLAAAADADAEPARVRPDATGLRALLVGSSPFELRSIARRLAEAGAEPVRVPDLARAEAALRRDRFDLLVVDAALGEAGIRLLAQPARAAGVGRTIILLSPFERRAYGPPGPAGYDAFLMKPVRARSLFERIGATPPAREEAADLAAETRAETLRPAVKRVLLAEDDDVNALVAMKNLQKLGALVDWAKDGIEAFRLAESAISGERPPYNLILMDMRMPGLDGIEVTRRIREREAASARDERCRIVALTASIVGGRERFRETAGFDGFLLKPFSYQRLAEELRIGVDKAEAA